MAKQERKNKESENLESAAELVRLNEAASKLGGLPAFDLNTRDKIAFDIASQMAKDMTTRNEHLAPDMDNYLEHCMETGYSIADKLLFHSVKIQDQLNG